MRSKFFYGFFHKRSTALSKAIVVILSLGLVAFVGSFDYLTGRDFDVTPFYLIPICWAGWVAGRRAGTFIVAASVIASFVADRYAGAYGHPLVPYWNALMLLVLFLVVTMLLSVFRNFNYRLEKTVQQRTAALQEEMARSKSLELAKLQAERLAVAGTMAAEVAHEIRNPLGSLTLNLDLIQKEIHKIAAGRNSADAEARVLIDEMREELQRIQRVIEEYLQFARLRKPQPRLVAINDAFEQKLALLHPECERANIKLQTHFDPALKLINVDVEQLWQAMLNLIRNSIEAMPGGGELTLSTACENKQMRLRVADTGTGMTEDQLRQVFQPFFTTKPAGTGLGLTLVQQIAAEHGGHAECDSVVGKGTSFTIVLPLAEVNDARDLERQLTEPALV